MSVEPLDAGGMNTPHLKTKVLAQDAESSDTGGKAVMRREPLTKFHLSDVEPQPCHGVSLLRAKVVSHVGK